MYATKGSWAGRTFALANSNDSVGKKSRIRRSKEERKALAESFIKKYQKLNNGNFPSLNLAHKEVGGSFYTVREIVREIIQENRVLGPPKFSSEEPNNQEFLEQHPLGSISMETQIESSVSGSIDVVTHIVPPGPGNQISNEENIYTSNEQLNGSFPFELDNEQIKGSSVVAENDEGIDRTSKSHHGLDYYLVNNDEKIVNGVGVLEESSHVDKPVIIDIDREDNNDSALSSSQKVNGHGSEILTNEHYNKNDEAVDKNEEFVERINAKSAAIEVLDTERCRAQDVEMFEAVNSLVNSNVVVETFPLRPVPKVVDDMDEKTPVNLQSSILEGSVSVGVDKGGEIAELVSGDAFLNETTKVSTKGAISEKSTLAESKASDEDSSSYPNGKNPTLNRINLGTWEGTSKKSSQPERNPLLAIVKAFFSSFVKFWTE
ncbi:DNA binding [Striga hermonthica]|uniref:DNA binding n=1 Tax=Striga hermonthica TaxID=68872 RepID=A0A9N7R746_STRHE|nr:DNA binding [Striga hermonthica]